MDHFLDIKTDDHIDQFISLLKDVKQRMERGEHENLWEYVRDEWRFSVREDLETL